MISVGIIGGGLSGTLVAIKLLKEFNNNLDITIFERKPVQIFRGVAYSSDLPFQPLNVRAQQMNLWQDKPGDFYRWLELHWSEYFPDKPAPTDFVQRHVFGDYLQYCFQHAMKNPVIHQVIDIVFDEATSIERTGKGFLVKTSSVHKAVDYVVLALGNFLPADLSIIHKGFYSTTFYQANPWNRMWMDTLQTNDPVLILGSGLTAVDQVINLLNTKHQGKIYIVSRRGLLPLSHANYETIEMPASLVRSGFSLLELYKMVRALVSESVQKGVDWRNVVDQLRNQIPYIWSCLPTEERKRFLRHVRPYWEIHRHRITEESFSILQKHITEGRIEIIAGRVLDFEAEENTAKAIIKLRGSVVRKTLKVAKVVNCTGPQTDYRKINQPLIQSLANAGHLKTDELNLGIAVNDDGRLINDQGQAIENIFAIGSLRKSAMWECTALREIALQADQFVDKLKCSFSS